MTADCTSLPSGRNVVTIKAHNSGITSNVVGVVQPGRASPDFLDGIFNYSAGGSVRIHAEHGQDTASITGPLGVNVSQVAGAMSKIKAAVTYVSAACPAFDSRKNKPSM